MEITEVRIKLTSGKNEKLRAFCSITIDNDFVIRDLKVIEGAKGAFVAMPSRKLMARCPFCSGKNHYRAPYCNECGGRLSPEKLSLDGRRKLHADVAHPINSGCRESIQQRVLAHYAEEKERAKDPNYRPADIDDFDDDFFDEEAELVVSGASPRWDDSPGSRADSPRSRDGLSGSRDWADRSDRVSAESDEASEDLAIEEDEWEEETGAVVAREDGDSVAPPRFADDEADRERPREAVASAEHSDDGRPSSGSRERGVGRRGGRSRQRSGGRRRRSRDPRRESVRPGDRNRLLADDGDEPSADRVEAERSPLAVDFDELRTGNRRSSGRAAGGRAPGGRAPGGRAPGGRAPDGPGAGGPRSGGSGSGGPSSGGWRESRRRDETTGEPRFGDRGRDRATDPARLGENRIRERRLAEEADTEPEDNFGAGLFS